VQACNLTPLNAELKRFSALPTFTAPGPPLDAKKLAGKTIFNIAQYSNIPFQDAVDKSMAAVAARLNLKFTQYPTQGKTDEYIQGMNQAINQKVDLISLSTVDTRRVQPQIAAAGKAGIPVVDSQFWDLSQLDQVGPGLAAVRADNFSGAAKLLADWVIFDTKCKANVLVLTQDDVSSGGPMKRMIQAEFRKYCPTCKASYQTIPVAEWATRMQSATQTALVGNPNINYIIPLFDSEFQFVVPAIKATRRVGKVHVASFNGTPFALKMLQSRDGIVRMDVGENLDWLAYANMDEILRVLSGMASVKNEHTPLRVFTKANIKQTGVPPAYNKGYGNAYVTGYNKLWGVG
jgi:ribose transport system substrate-binding protein